MINTAKSWCRRNLVITVFMLSLGLPLAAYGQEKGKSHDEAFDRIVNELNLSPSQKDEIAKERSSRKAESENIRAELKQKRNELSEELEKESSDKSRISAIISEMKELTARRMEQRVESILALKKVLTPSQYKALNEKTRGLRGRRSHQ